MRGLCHFVLTIFDGLEEKIHGVEMEGGRDGKRRKSLLALGSTTTAATFPVFRKWLRDKVGAFV